MTSTTTTRRSAVLLGVLAVAALTACSGDTDPSPAGPEQPTVQDQAAEQRRAGRAKGSIALGDLNKPKSFDDVGAPFDPCALDWSDLPEQVRPTDGKPHAPQLRHIDEDDPFVIRCLYDNSGKVVLKADGTRAGNSGHFIVSVVWGTEIQADPAKRKNAEAKTWDGKPGLIQRFPDDPKTGKSCLGLIRLSEGVGGASVTNGRFDVDACAVAEAAVKAITARTR